MPFVCSTGTNDAYYCEYDKGGSDLPLLKKRVLIKGGANRGGKNLMTPKGVVTQVTDEELEFLKNNDAFKRHVSRGFLTVVEQKKQPDVEKVAKDMTKKEQVAQLTDSDYLPGGRQYDGKTEAPVVGKPDAKASKKSSKA